MNESTFDQLRDTGIGVEPHEQRAPDMQERAEEAFRAVNADLGAIAFQAMPFDLRIAHAQQSPLSGVKPLLEELTERAKSSFKRGVLVGICIGSIPSAVYGIMYLAR